MTPVPFARSPPLQAIQLRIAIKAACKVTGKRISTLAGVNQV
jgi:hypothetical protein